MRKVIKGKLYDTATAKFLGEYESTPDVRDFHREYEKLYQKKTGEFFVYGEGGPLTKYARRELDGWTSGEEITPLTYAKAQEWTEKHLDADDYESIFGPVTEDETKITCTFRLTASTLERVKRAAAEKGSNLSEYVESRLA